MTMSHPIDRLDWNYIYKEIKGNAWFGDYVKTEKFGKNVLTVHIKGEHPDWQLEVTSREHNGIDESRKEKYLAYRNGRVGNSTIEYIDRCYEDCSERIHLNERYDSLDDVGEALQRTLLKLQHDWNMEVSLGKCRDSSYMLEKELPWTRFKKNPFSWMGILIEDGIYVSVSEDIRDSGIEIYTNSQGDSGIITCRSIDEALPLLERTFEVHNEHNT